MGVNEQIRNFVKSEILNNQNGLELSFSTELIQSGIIDSLGIMKLLSFLEENFSIRISESDLIPENFKDIDTISHLIEKIKTDA